MKTYILATNLAVPARSLEAAIKKARKITRNRSNAAFIPAGPGVDVVIYKGAENGRPLSYYHNIHDQAVENFER